MKRFVTYLYEYHGGKKEKNIGFIRVKVRNEKTDMQVVIRNCLQTNEDGKIFALINKKNLMGIELGEIKIINGQSDGRIIVSTDNIMGCGYSVNEIVGIGIRLQSNEYFASCWKDEFADEIARGEFLLEAVSLVENQNVEDVSEELPEERIVSTREIYETLEKPLAAAEKLPLYESEIHSQNVAWQAEPDRDISYEKIDLVQIRDLPSPNWHLTTNSFLVHGFANFGYLVLKKEIKTDKETLSLGVPGIFEKPEAVMAILFGFPEFEALPSEMVEAEMNVEKTFPYKEKNQEPRVGLFGCWFVDLKK